MTDSGNSLLVLVRYVSMQFHEFTRNKKKDGYWGQGEMEGREGEKKKKKSTNCPRVRRILHASLRNKSQTVPTAILIKPNDALHKLQVSI